MHALGKELGEVLLDVDKTKKIIIIIINILKFVMEKKQVSQ